MKIRYFVPVMLIIAAASSGVFAKTGTEQTQQKPIAPFTKKSEASVKLAPKPAPAPLPAPTTRTSISGRNYIGAEIGITGSTLTGAEDYFILADYPLWDDPFTDPSTWPLTLNDYQAGVGFLIGGVIDIAFNPSLGLQGKLTFRNHQFNASATDSVLDFDGVRKPITNDYSGALNYLGIDALLRIQITEDALYGLAGFGFGSLMSNTNEATQKAGGDLTYNILPSGTPTTSNQLEFPSQSFEDFYATSRVDAKLGLGTFIPLGNDGMVLTPELLVGIPLTPLFQKDIIDAYESLETTVPNMVYATLSIGLKFPWGANSSSSSYSSSSSSNDQETPEPGKATLRGRVIDNAGEPIDDATVTVVDLNTNEVVATDETDDGIYNVKVNAPGRYSVTADAPGYLFGSAYFEVDKDGRILRHSGDIKLSPSTDGRVRLLIFFDFDKATLQSSSYPELNRAVALMKANPSMEVEIAGYTDAQGTDAYNKDLSQRRANTVREYLVRQGVEGSRVTAMGYGEANPVATNDTEDGRAENRRVEFVVKRR